MTPIGNICKHDNTFNCFKWTECSYKSLSECLKISVVAQSRELEHMKHRKMQKHSEASLKWRGEAMYYKKKAKALELYITEKGLEIPHVERLFGRAKEEGGDKDDRIRDNVSKEEHRERPAV